MSNIYRFSFNALLAKGTGPEDALAAVVSAIDAVTIIADAGNHPPLMGVHSFYADFVGQGDNEAMETARRAEAAIPNCFAVDAVMLHHGQGKARRRVTPA